MKFQEKIKKDLSKEDMRELKVFGIKLFVIVITFLIIYYMVFYEPPPKIYMSSLKMTYLFLSNL